MTSIPEGPFSRIEEICPTRVMEEKTVICVGAGGARGYLEALARCGVGHFVVFDGDTVTLPNIATQGVYADELGQNKAYCVADSIRRIHPTAEVTVVPQFLDESVSDRDFELLVGPALGRKTGDVVLAGCTDSFYAQARTANLALKYGLPYVAAQLYKGGLAAELYFSYPGVTTGGCPRCAMFTRYNAYLHHGYQNDVTTAGASIFATERVNAIKGELTLMLLLYGEKCAGRYAARLKQVAKRNYLQIRMDPGAGSVLGLSVFETLERDAVGLTCFDETLWLEQHPEADCPLCDGKADLRSCMGSIEDTRYIQ